MTRLFAGTDWDQPPKCDRCNELEAACHCPPPVRPLTPPEKQTAKLSVEKRKRGKLMTVVLGLAAAENDLPALLSQFKNACGAGGTVKDDQVEIQGDQRQRVEQVLTNLGYRIQK